MRPAKTTDPVQSSTDKLTVYMPRSGWAALDLRGLWAYRDLLYFLAWRDVLVRYKQAVLGGFWAVIQPVLTMIVFTFVFNRALGVQSPDPSIPYPVFSLSGLVVWQFFAGALSRSGVSLVGNASLLTKVYFPRMVIPASAVFAVLVDFAISFVVLLILMGAYGILPSWHIVFTPFFVLMAIAAALSVSMWLSPLNVLYRDVQYAIPFFIQLWMFVSPIIYSIDSIPEGWMRVVFALNPMTGVIGGLRWSLLGSSQPFPGVYLWISLGVILMLLFTGLYYFKRMERRLADVV